MQFEKINNDKIRIIFNIDELKERNIDYHEFMSNSIESQTIFLDILNQAEKEVGFKTDNYKLLIEALASSNGSFIITITRSKDNKKKKKAISIKKEQNSISKTMPTLIYLFKNFDLFLDTCNIIPEKKLNSLNKIFKQCILYSLNNNYYLVLKTNENANILDVKYIISLISEFSNNIVPASELFENKLTEYGKIVLKNNCFIKLSQKINKEVTAKQ